MTKQAVIGTILFLVFLTKGLSYAKENNRKINLTEEAVSYAANTGEGLKKLSFANECGTKDGQRLYATVGQMELGSDCWNTQNSQNPDCKNVYWWIMNSSLLTPLNLTVNVTLLKLDKTHYTVSLDLNDSAWIQWNPQDVENDTYHQAVTNSTSCEFSVKIALGGTFCYEVERARGDNPKSDTVVVTNLANPRKGLGAAGKELTYNITGRFKHEMVCTEEDKKVKKLRKPKGKSQKSRVRKLTITRN